MSFKMQGLFKRVQKELSKLSSNPTPGINICDYEVNSQYFCWEVEGPAGTPYEGGVFTVKIYLPLEYPACPPLVNFMTPIFHPNVDYDGSVCLNVLEKDWNPSMEMRTVMIFVQALMAEPNPEDPFSQPTGRLWMSNRAEAERIARTMTRNYAMEK